MKRLSDKDFPPYNFIPGKFPHPEKEGGYHYGQELEFEVINADILTNKSFLYAIDLYNHGYFWESHVHLEGLWHQVRKSNESLSNLLKALIKLCAAGVKDLQGMSSASEGHMKRAYELFNLSEKSLVSEVMSLLVK